MSTGKILRLLKADKKHNYLEEWLKLIAYRVEQNYDLITSESQDFLFYSSQ